LLAKQDGGVALDPREYQIELFERAKAQNTIAVLDTGMTFSCHWSYVVG
jgi:endoribonuclease Dicer